MKNIDKDDFFPPNEDTIDTRNELINKTVFSFGVEENQNIVHIGCGSRNRSLAKFISKCKMNYLGIDIDESEIINCRNENEKLTFESVSAQDFIDQMKITSKKCDWSIIDGVLDKNLYEDHQYDWLDTLIRECLYFSEIGVILILDGKKTINDESYNPEFISAYISSMYNRFMVSRLNEYQWVVCIYKYYF